MTTPNDPFAAPSFPSTTTGDPFGQPIDERKNNLALVGLILGIVSLVLTLTLYGIVLSWLTAIVGLIICIVALVKAKNYAPANKRKGMAVVGLVLSILVIIAAALVGITVVVMWSVFEPCLNMPQDQMSQCVDEQLNLQYR